MRINQFIAKNSSLSRRSADRAVSEGRVYLNGEPANNGDQITSGDVVLLNNVQITESDAKNITIVLNKPIGYVCSRNGQGSQTIYDLLPSEYKNLNSVGRLDKESSGLILLTNDGNLANELTHPKFKKIKVYEVKLNKSLEPLHQQMINDFGIQLEDGISKLTLEKITDDNKNFKITMHEGRNRQIRRTFNSLGYEVTKLHRTNFGNYNLGQLGSGKISIVT